MHSVQLRNDSALLQSLLAAERKTARARMKFNEIYCNSHSHHSVNLDWFSCLALCRQDPRWSSKPEKGGLLSGSISSLEPGSQRGSAGLSAPGRSCCNSVFPKR